MKHFISTLFCACGLMLAASCSSNGNEEFFAPGVVDSNFEIVPSSGLGQVSAHSRASVSPAETTNLAVSVFRVDQTAEDSYPTAFTAVSTPKAATLAGDTRTSQGNAKIDFTTKEYYLSNGLKTKVLAVYPAVSSTDWTASANTLAYTVDGKKDIMVTSWGEGYKNLSVTPAVAVQPAGMVFEHQLTQIRVKVYAVDATARDYWGDIESIAVTGRATSCTIALPSIAGGAAPVATFGTETDGSFILINDADATAALLNASIPVAAASAASVGHSLFAPVTTSAKLPLTITTKKDGVTTPTNIEVATQTYVSGTAYTITLKLTAIDIVPEGVTISEWTPVDVGEIVI